MKTTMDINDALLKSAKKHAKKKGVTLKALVEDGLSRVVYEVPAPKPYVFRDCRVGKPGDPDPFAGMEWSEVRRLSYEPDDP